MAKTKKPDPSWKDGLTTFQRSLLEETLRAEIEEVGEKVTGVLNKWDKEIEELGRKNQLPNPAMLLTYVRSDIEKALA